MKKFLTNNKMIAVIAASSLLLGIFAVVVAFSDMSDTLPDVRTVKSFVSACDAADRMTVLSCGAVSQTDISLDNSAFRMEFVPPEPDYVERFRNYSGPAADFVPVMMYHSFYDATVDRPTKGTNSHSIQSVQEQLQWLWENGYVTLTMDELYEWLNGNIEVPAKCIVLTSDDGKDDFFELLQPVLHQYGFVATSFVITSYRKNLPYKLTLPNIEMHSHTHNMHRGEIAEGGIPDNRGMMQGVSVEYGVADLKTSADNLNGSRYFAYPYGTYGGNAKTIVKEAGFRLAFTTRYGVVRRGDDPYELRRVRVSGSETTFAFQNQIRYSTVAQKYQ